MLVAKILSPRAFVIAGVALFFSGSIYVQVLAQSSTGGGILFLTWISIQTTSYILCLVGFTRLLLKQSDEPRQPSGRNRIKVGFSRVALLSIISGLTLTFPLLQISFPIPIATVLVTSGLILIGVSLVAWLVSLVIPNKGHLET